MKLLKSGRFFVVQTEYAERHLPKAAGFRWDGDAKYTGKKQWYTSECTKAAALAEYADPELRRELEQVAARQADILEGSVATNTERAIITKPGCTFFSYQKGGIASALDRFDLGYNVLLGDEMGLGKTMQAVGIIDNIPEVRRVLVICPASIKRNWERELSAWLVKDLTIGVQISHAFPETDIVVINYDALKKFRALIRQTEWDLLICDEAHYLKNHKTNRSAEVMGRHSGGQLIEPINAKRKLFLTGSPMPNDPTEIYGLANFLAPRLLGSFRSFVATYSDPDRLEELQVKLRETIMIRRLKKDVLSDLPAKIRQVIELPVSGAGREAVQAELAIFNRLQSLEQELKARATSGANPDEPEYREAVKALREAQKVAFQEMSKRRHETAKTKIPAVIEYVEGAIEQSSKVVMFGHHQDLINAVAKHFGAACVVIDGGTPPERRQAIVDRFQTDPSVKLFIGSAAAREGITLTAASHVIMAELDWVPGNVSQSEDRCHRIGQRNSVLVQHLVLEGSLDARMALRIIEKQAALDASLNTKAGEDPEVRARETVAEARRLRDDVIEAARQRVELDRATEEARSAGREDTAPPALVEAVKTGVLILAGFDPDGARVCNGVGFNQTDSHFGHSIARQIQAGRILSVKQVKAAAKMLTKYRKQIGSSIAAQLAA